VMSVMVNGVGGGRQAGEEYGERRWSARRLRPVASRCRLRATAHLFITPGAHASLIFFTAIFCMPVPAPPRAAGYLHHGALSRGVSPTLVAPRLLPHSALRACYTL